MKQFKRKNSLNTQEANPKNYKRVTFRIPWRPRMSGVSGGIGGGIGGGVGGGIGGGVGGGGPGGGTTGGHGGGSGGGTKIHGPHLHRTQDSIVWIR